MVGHKSLSGADVRSEEIIVTSRVWHPWGTLPSASVPDGNALERAPPGRIGSSVPPQGWAVDDLSHFTRERRVRDVGHVRVSGGMQTGHSWRVRTHGTGTRDTGHTEWAGGLWD